VRREIQENRIALGLYMKILHRFTLLVLHPYINILFSRLPQCYKTRTQPYWNASPGVDHTLDKGIAKVLGFVPPQNGIEVLFFIHEFLAACSSHAQKKPI
jgi:hypothetical protein